THDGKDGANINSAEEFFENGGAPIYTKLRNMAFVNVENNVTRTYNGTQITPVVTWGTGPSAEPLVNGRDYTITFVDAPARPYAAPGTDAGAGTFTITGIGNYTGTTTARNFTITKKPITVTVTPGQTKIFGEDDPAAFIYTYIPALLGDDRFTGLLNRTPGEDAGSYRINQNTLTVNNNYEIIFISADFVITRAPQLEKPDTARTFTDTAKIASGVPGISVVVNESGTVSYTVDAGNRLEYCIANCEDDNNWVADLDLSSLRPNMEYGIFVRIQGTENYEPSEPEVIRFRTMTEGVSIKESDRNVPTVSTDGFGADDSGKASDSRYGLVINQRIVTQKAEFSVTAPGKASAAIIVYDNLGKIVFKSKNVRSGQPVSWNLINRQGRAAGSGSYLVIAVVRDANGKTYRYSEQVYVRR
ncbi:MAG: hypothetical protein FWE57_07925, partial [Chitinispirillia bacterium]|nr:hypothetical protein [Chitinispirillia bacterium]